MVKEITLLEEQAKNIEQKIEIINQKRRDLIETYRIANIGNSSKDRASDTSDSNYEATLQNLDKQLIRLENLLKNATIINQYAGETIEIGTRFAATLDYDGEMETEEYVLVSTKEGSGSRLRKRIDEAIYITIDSPLGKSVIGRRIGDPVCYKVNNMNVVGFIEDIVPIVNNEMGNQKRIKR